MVEDEMEMETDVTEEDEEDEESEDEDVFAYLPPTTADVAASMQPPSFPSLSSEHYDDRPRTQHGAPPSLVTSAGRHQPPPSAFTMHHHAHTDSYPSTLPPFTPFSHLPVETPPSTDSQADHTDPYHMRRLESGIALTTPPMTGISGNGSAASQRLSVSRGGSRGVRVELPIPTAPEVDLGDNEKIDLDYDEKGGADRRYSDASKMRPTSIDSTDAGASMTPSMMNYTTDDLESTGSIK